MTYPTSPNVQAGNAAAPLHWTDKEESQAEAEANAYTREYHEPQEMVLGEYRIELY